MVTQKQIDLAFTTKAATRAKAHAFLTPDDTALRIYMRSHPGELPPVLMEDHAATCAIWELVDAYAAQLGLEPRPNWREILAGYAAQDRVLDAASA